MGVFHYVFGIVIKILEILLSQHLAYSRLMPPLSEGMGGSTTTATAMQSLGDYYHYLKFIVSILAIIWTLHVFTWFQDRVIMGSNTYFIPLGKWHSENRDPSAPLLYIDATWRFFSGESSVFDSFFMFYLQGLGAVIVSVLISGGNVDSSIFKSFFSFELDYHYKLRLILYVLFMVLMLAHNTEKKPEFVWASNFVFWLIQWNFFTTNETRASAAQIPLFPVGYKNIGEMCLFPVICWVVMFVITVVIYIIKRCRTGLPKE